MVLNAQWMIARASYLEKRLAYSVQGLLRSDLFIDLALGHFQFCQPNLRYLFSSGFNWRAIFPHHLLSKCVHHDFLYVFTSLCALAHQPLPVANALLWSASFWNCAADFFVWSKLVRFATLRLIRYRVSFCVLQAFFPLEKVLKHCPHPNQLLSLLAHFSSGNLMLLFFCWLLNWIAVLCI